MFYDSLVRPVQISNILYILNLWVHIYAQNGMNMQDWSCSSCEIQTQQNGKE